MAGKIYAITGAASGMGLATAQLLAARGASISLADYNEPGLQQALQSMTGDHLAVQVDVRDAKSVQSWIDKTVAKYGKIDGAVNMAGIIRPAVPLQDMQMSDWDATFAVNVTGMVHCLQAQLQVVGSIVMAASVFGQFGAPGNSAYCASKAAVIALCKTAAKENPQVRINCVSPGSVNTPMSQGEHPDDVARGLQVTVQKRRADPEEIGRVIAFLLSEEASFVTGAVWNVDGGWVC